MNTLLELFDRFHVRATFFFLADIANSHPHLVTRCAKAGHEIASHGLGHHRLDRLTPPAFRESASASKARLEDLAGHAVHGYRAPSWSVIRKTAWALPILTEVGYTYDASIFPVRHPAYGIPNAPTRPFFAQSTPDQPPILELPPLTWRLLGRNLPAAGGAYFRLFPLTLITRALEQAAAENRPAILYFHPWEFDPAQPRMPLSLPNRLRTYLGIPAAVARLEKLLAYADAWQPLGAHLDAFRAAAQRSPAFALQPSPVVAPHAPAHS